VTACVFQLLLKHGAVIYIVLVTLGETKEFIYEVGVSEMTIPLHQSGLHWESM
jgi:hypothetical protein